MKKRHSPQRSFFSTLIETTLFLATKAGPNIRIVSIRHFPITYIINGGKTFKSSISRKMCKPSLFIPLKARFFMRLWKRGERL